MSRTLLGVLLWAASASSSVWASQPTDLARETLKQHGIVLSPLATGTDWPETTVQALAGGLGKLPAHLRTPPGGVLELEWSARTMPFGMGDGSSDAPEWSKDARRFVLYAFTPSTERRAEYRVENLQLSEQEALWRQRAIIHAVMKRWDDRERWSARPDWRKLNGWIHPFERLLSLSEHALNLAEWAYSRRRGMASSQLDLLTFAEEALSPVEGLNPNALAEADQVRCQELSKSRFLASIGVLTRARGTCSTFEAWADARTLDGFELLFVAASGRSPESLFGHLLLRIARQDSSRVVGPGLTPAVQLVALTGGDLPGPNYVLRGLFGGYPMVLMTVPMLDVTRQMLEFEQRTMRRFRLRLTPEESERLFERIWELERRGRLDYRFLHDNCAFSAAFLVNGALVENRAITLPARLTPLIPTATLDSMAKATSGLGGSLLVPVPGSLDSTRDLARNAHQRRLAEALRLQAVKSRALRLLVLRLTRQAESHDGAERLAAYQRLARVAPKLISDSPELGEGLFSYFAHSADMERYAFDSAETEAIKAKLAALLEPPPLSTGEEEASSRAKQFEREADLAAAVAVLDRPQRAQAMLDALPKRPFNEAERRAVEEADAAANRLEALLALQTEVSSSVPKVDPLTWFRENRQATAERERALTGRALGPSGYGRTAVSMGATGRNGSWVPMLTLKSAAFSEELGDHRSHGLDASSELTTLAGEVTFVPGSPFPIVRSSELIAAEYRNVRREPAPFREDDHGNLGWGFRAGWGFDTRREFSQRAFVSSEALVILLDTPDLSAVTTIGLGAHTALGLEALAPELIAGPRATFNHRSHLGGSHANAVKLGVSYAPAYLVFRGRWQQEIRATAKLEVLAQLGRIPLVISLIGGLEWFDMPKGRNDVVPSLALAVEPVAF